VVGQRPDFLHVGTCCWIGNGGEGGVNLRSKQSKIGRCNKFAPRGLCRVGTTPSCSGGCRRHNFGNSQRQVWRCSGYIQCCWTKSGNLAVATALADPSEAALISWFNSCAAIHALARMGCQQSEQLITTRAFGLSSRRPGPGELILVLYGGPRWSG
jgi:hypothetical protein